MNKKLILIAIIFFILGFFTGKSFVKPIKPPDPKIIYLDSLIRDTLWLKNDSIKKEIKKEEKVQAELVDSILSADDSTNLQYFSKYIENYNNQ